MPKFLQRFSIVHIGLITLAVWLAVMGLRSQGLLEGLELEAYDWSMRLSSQRLNESPPITLVTITEQDIQTLGHWPISEEVLAKALTRMHRVRE